MSSSTVTCPSCHQALRSDRAIPSGARLRCPSCQAQFTQEPLDLSLAPPSPSLFGAPFLISISVALLLGASIIIAALLGASRPQTPVPIAEPRPDDSAQAKREEENRKLEERRKELDKQQNKLELARLLARGQALEQKGQFNEAATLYEQALKLEPDNAEAFKALVSARAGETAATKVKEDEAKRQAEVDRLLTEGKKALADRQFALALRTLESAQKLAPGNKLVLEALAEAQNALDADQAQKQKLADHRKFLEAGKVALAAERFTDAVREFTAALQLMPDDLEAQQGRKQAEAKLAGLADREKRRAAFDNLLDRGRKAHADRRYNDAIAALEPALRLVPDDREAQRLLRAAQAEKKAARSRNVTLLAQAEEAARLGRLDEAQRLAEEAAKNWPEDEQAQKVLRNATRLAETVQNTQGAYLRHMQAGAVAMNLGRFADAVNAYTEALRLAPNDLEVQQNLRLARVALERDLRIRLEYEKLIRAGSGALTRRSHAEAMQLFGDALKIAPADLVAADGLSRARFGKALADGQLAGAQRRKADAIRAFSAALAEKPGDLLAQQGLRQAQLMR